MDLHQNFDTVKIILDVPFNKKEIAKKYGARWSPDIKKWYIVNNIDENFDSKKCFGNIRIICIFDIVEIIHDWHKPDSKEYNDLLIRYKDLKKELRNEKIRCVCGCKYKFKKECKHMSSEKHLNYLKNEEDDKAFEKFEKYGAFIIFERLGLFIFYKMVGAFIILERSDINTE